MIGFPVVGTLIVTEDLLVPVGVPAVPVVPGEIVGVNPLHAPSQITYAAGVVTEAGTGNGILSTVTVTEPFAAGLEQLKLPPGVVAGAVAVVLALHAFVVTIALVTGARVPVLMETFSVVGMAVVVPVT